ncbi:Nif3-like dinuclear metal center hexameric protein [Salinispira pacifica]|nr:Nif3-like dinuclear metal center hexameric protein [Salinispira pacifica]
MNISQLDRWLKEELNMEQFSRIDNSKNGLQVSRREQKISTAAFAVDASLETFRRCEDIGADILIVHHGLFWGREELLTGYHYERIRFLMEHDIALYAIHLPLDAHPSLGNNAGIAASLGLSDVKPFGLHKGIPIGMAGRLDRPMELFAIQQKLFGFDGNVIASLPFGPDEISSVAIVSGGAAFDVDEAIEKGYDLFITGDASHTIYHRCLEAGINVIFAGHYLTEVWGVKLLMEHLLKGPGSEAGIHAEFIDVPTGL